MITAAPKQKLLLDGHLYYFDEKRTLLRKIIYKVGLWETIGFFLGIPAKQSFTKITIVQQFNLVNMM